MDVTFKNSKDGNLTCTKGNISLHSSFNPIKEAERFVESISSSFLPSYIVMTGSCLGYASSFLRQRFPAAKLVSIQYSKSFAEYDDKWDKAFVLDEDSDAKLLEEELFSVIGEEKLFSTLFISWKPSEKAWPDLASSLWKSFKELLSKAESIISTRNYFNKRWFINSVKFFIKTQKICLPQKTDKPIIVTASGPSLASAMPFLKENRGAYILLSASSSLLPLLENDIIPDFCISTDGGWWAKKHLEPLLRKNISIPLIIPPEAASPGAILSNIPIVPLNYGDFPGSLFFQATDMPYVMGERNGTVSGTAAVLALSMTSGNVFFCGLDLAVSKQYQHTQPNALEIINSQKDDRLHPLETRCASSSFSGSASLSIYRNWFATRGDSFYKRVFRLVTANDNLEQIPHLQDIFIDKTSACLFQNISLNKSCERKEITLDTGKNESEVFQMLKKIKDEIETKPETPYNYEWYKMAALKDVIQAERTGDKTVLDDIHKKTIQFLDEAISKTSRTEN